MNERTQTFKISSRLKDVLGRGLVTNEFVAVFELVKNGFDAGATSVVIEIDPFEGRIAIADDGKGMSRQDIIERWLFLAYSAKADGSEDSNIPKDYRDLIGQREQFAGNKGIGRLSCDTLGKTLELYSRAIGQDQIQKLSINWEDFEQDSKEEFGEIEVSLTPIDSFPEINCGSGSPSKHGTVLWIEGARHSWNADATLRLRQYLAKLIDPFGTTDDVDVITCLIGYEDEKGAEPNEVINGPVGNSVADVLRDKTTRIEVLIENGEVETRLVDRGTTMLHIREPLQNEALAKVTIRGEIFFLNRSAKATFARRMGVMSVEFGSIFLFLNGFRVFPIGEETDDTFGLNRRKQQGVSRFLGTRDVMGRVDIRAAPGIFREASSRDQGLISDANQRALYDAIRSYMVIRLERYVTGVNWKIKADQYREDRSALESDQGRELAISVLGRMASPDQVKVLSIAPDLERVAEGRRATAQRTLSDLDRLAEKAGDSEMRKRVAETRQRIAELEEAERAASREAANLAEMRAADAVKIDSLERQARFLSASSKPTSERLQLLLHQVSIYSNHIHSSSLRAARDLVKALEMIPSGDDIDPEDLEDLAAALRHNMGELKDEVAYITLEADRLKALTRFAPNLDVEVDRAEMQDDLLTFLREYIEVIVGGADLISNVVFKDDGKPFITTFSPFDIAVIVDNLVDNSRKANAQEMKFSVESRTKKGIALLVTDDGIGLRDADPAKIFELGYTSSAGGSGLGLYHIRKVMNGMNGSIELASNREEGRADFVLKFVER
ncbi:histidine kinase [Hwanghaeella grinnelliae]|uniref:histidine kinase n=1 Tax=Hwanghaeella grinnelliae TaxID=2500179 RepID=A0A437QUE9_9PROT|nr:ATP-binding protein [Hwanghaeella grinnelliae]RVU38135.1 histidine kinase [Hwanghaeella grinnelliae]